MAYILLVDDESEGVEGAAAYLHKAGHRTVVLENGRQAIALFQEAVPDILVVDIMLPGADGFEVVHELRQHSQGKSTAVIVLTTLGADGEPGRDWELPIESYILRQYPSHHMVWQIILNVEQLVHRRVVTES
jgi:DNA-binding response OmpR family regulator